MTPRIPAAPNGAVAVEYGIILPAMLLFVLGIVDTGRLLWTYATLTHAVEAAARCGAIAAPGCTSAATTQSYAVTQAYGLTVPSSAFSVSSASCGVQVSGSLSFVFVIPWLGASPFGSANSITVSATACDPT